ncbi:hypothetical protein [Sorangium sp. So ce291]|uniref:hypothetical protein n=1 Tax=Sorangium sp. So ce291 TaxID=3133294 RepID=UPI003F5DE92E
MLAIADVDEVALAVDVLDPQRADLIDPQTGAVRRQYDRALLDRADRVEQRLDLGAAEDRGVNAEGSTAPAVPAAPENAEASRTPAGPAASAERRLGSPGTARSEESAVLLVIQKYILTRSSPPLEIS